MQTLILPGSSPSDKSWADKVAVELKAEEIIRPFYWMHWTDESKKFNPQEKAELIVKHLKGDMINIIAKGEGIDVANRVKSLVPDQVISMKQTP